MSTDTSDPAFPLPLGNQNIHPSVAGLTKREWFAGMVVQGMYANRHIYSEITDELMAQNAYHMADAMIGEGKK